MAGSCSSSAVARFMQYGDCFGTLFPRKERTSIPAIRQWRRAAGHHVPPPVQRVMLAPPAKHHKRGQLQAVAQRLRPMGQSG